MVNMIAKGLRALRAGRPARVKPVAKKKSAKKKSAVKKAQAQGSTLKGSLAKLGITREFDLVLHLPLRYEDETTLTTIAAASNAMSAEPVQVEGRVVRTEVAYRPRRQLISRIEDETGVLALRFFNFYPSHTTALAEGATVRAFGEVKSGFFGGEMIHPRFRVLRSAEPLPDALTPVYPATAGLGQSTLRQLIGRALAKESLDEVLPREILAPLKLPAFAAAVEALHHPKPGEDESLQSRSHPAWQRMKFDELLAQQLSLRIHYRRRRARSAPVLAERKGSGSGKPLTQQLLARLPFKLTRAQIKVWSEISRDLAQPHPMHRLLQGDVGSGKTVVAALAALVAVDNGRQAAVMAPTEILAEQHFRKFSDWLAPLGLSIAWLSGSQSGAERKRMLAAVESGETQIVVGTHALFQDKVRFKSLALAIVDEQHRFGVAQRLALRKKARNGEEGDAGTENVALEGLDDVSVKVQVNAETEPHQLMMSATPIPRTLSMSVYADLDVSVIDELPPGRKPVLTKLLSASRRAEVVARIRDACEEGRQAYWVCPLIEESETLDLQTAIDTHVALSEDLPELKIGLVHGRLPPAEKAAIMQSFVAGELNVLVATTVIEVGVDVPNASLMVIEHAERFGLAQLHQLRGRVGRGEAESVCILLYQGPLSGNARERLKVIYESSDGFAIAEADLHIRGPGEYLGQRQSGAPLLRFADLLADTALVQAANAAAERMLEKHPDAVKKHLARWLGGRSEFMQA